MAVFSSRPTFNPALNATLKWMASVFVAQLLVGPAGAQSLEAPAASGSGAQVAATQSTVSVLPDGLGSTDPEASSTIRLNEFSSRFFNRLRVGFFNFTSTNAKQTHLGQGRLESYNYFGLDYSIARGKKISIRPAFIYNLSGHDFRGREQEPEFRWSDTYIQVSDNNFAYLPWNVEVLAKGRVYLPTSNESKDRGEITTLRGWMILSKPFSRDLEVNLHAEPRYHIQSRAGFLKDNGYPAGNRHWGYKAWVEGAYRLSRRFGLAQSVGFDQDWYHAVASENVLASHNEDLLIDTSVQAYLGPVSISGGISQQHNVRRPYNRLSLYRDDESSYYVRSYFNF